MNTRSAITILTVTASLFAVTACGTNTEHPAAHPQAASAQQSSARAAQDAYLEWLAQRARAESARRGPCRISPVLVERWASGTARSASCAAGHTRAQEHFGDDRRTPR